MITFLSALLVAAAVVWGALRVAQEIRAARSAAERERSLQLMTLFAPAIAAAADDPRALLTWQPLAATARTLFPSDFEALDRASGGRFPFSAETIDAAHARWSTDWLSWERAHDAQYKLKAAEVEEELKTSSNQALGRSRLEAVEREKVERYQHRYSEYVRVSRALQALIK